MTTTEEFHSYPFAGKILARIILNRFRRYLKMDYYQKVSAGSVQIVEQWT